MSDEYIKPQFMPIDSANAAYVAVHKEATSQVIDRKTIKAVKQFVDSHIPVIPENALEGVKGVISNAHLLQSCLVFAVDSGDQRARAALDQSARLMGHSERTFTVEQMGSLAQTATGRGTGTKDVTLPNLVEIPTRWKSNPDGTVFSEQLNNFIERRKNGRPLSNEDIDALKDMQQRMVHAYDGESATPDDVQNTPFARELILIQLGILEQTSGRKIGQPLEPQDALLQIQSIRGLLNYSKSAVENAARIRSGPFVHNIPTIIPLPTALRT